MTQADVSDTRLETIYRTVRLEGITPIMFDRYAGDNDTRLAWSQKIYLIPGTSRLCLPTLNLVSFCTAHNTNSAPKRLLDARKYKAVANAILSFVSFESVDGDTDYIPILKDNTPIEVGDFDDALEPKSGIFLHRSVARLEKGIPNPKERPVLPLPWAIEFKMTMYKNPEIKEQFLKNLITDGGRAIGLGTFRGVFGKFAVTRWD